MEFAREKAENQTSIEPMIYHLKAPSKFLLKRVLDYSCTLTLLPLLLFLSLAIAIILRLSSKGRVIYTQYRVGKDGKLFKIYKFRTMHENAEEILKNTLKNNPVILEEWKKRKKLKNDPRITKIGKFLRKTSLDELPQFLNVIKGEMSLVGPRPFLPNEIKEIKHCKHIILSTLPGITGLWQVNGRSNTTFSERVDLDCKYVMNWSLWLDIKILLKTIKAVLKCDGAY